MNFELNEKIEPDDAEFLTDIGQAFEKGTVFQKDYRSAFDCYNAASKYGNVRAMLNLAVLYQNGLGIERSYEKAAQLYEMASELGNSDSMVCLGKMYETGLIGNMKNYKKALYWYDKAAEAGNQDGLFKYAESLFLGKGVRKNYKLAFVVFVTLNNSGYKEAAYYLGQYYEKGIQIEKDYEKALYYYETGAHKQ